MKKTNAENKGAWFALADAESCRLLYCCLTKQGTQHVEEYDTIKNGLSEQEHIRPSSGEPTHNIEDNKRRFASEIVAWLRRQADQHEIDRLVIFAPPRMLGMLRMVPLGSLKGHLERLKGDLMRLHAGQLADHPMVRELLTQHLSDESTALEPAALSAP